jgi:hypothetical protein
MNEPLRALGQRLRQSDMMQLLTGFFVLLFFTVLLSWPSAPTGDNDSWYSLVRVNALAVMFIGIACGASESRFDRLHQRATLLALVVLSLLSWPLVVLTYAATYPGVPLLWSLLTPLACLAYYGVGLALGWSCGKLRLRFLLSLLVPALLVGLIMVDIWLKVAVFNPFVVATHVSMGHLAVMVGLGALTLAGLAWRGARGRDDQPQQTST